MVSVLIAFMVDRCYDTYKDGRKKSSFVKEQVEQFQEEVD